MLNRVLALTVAFGFIIPCIFGQTGQTGQITGIVLSEDGISSIPGVLVEVDKGAFSTASNGSGVFMLNDIPTGNHTLSLTSVGFDSYLIDVEVVEGQIARLSCQMKETVANLSPITILSGGSNGVKRIAGSVQFISPKQIEKQHYTDVNRVLGQIPGVNIQEEDGFGLRPNIGLRGSGVERTSKISIMEDGVLMAPAPYAAPSAYYFPTIGRMNAIEVMKGSSQIKYGPYTTGGAINLVSTPIIGEESGLMKYQFGSFNHQTLHANYQNSIGAFDYLIETFQQSAKGFKTLDNDGHTGFHKQDYLAKVRYTTKDEVSMPQTFTFKIGTTSEDGNETYLGLTESDFEATPYRRYAASANDNITTRQHQMSLNHTIRFTPNVVWNTTVYRTKFQRNWYKLDKVQGEDGALISIASLLNNPAANETAYDIITGATTAYGNALSVKANNRSYYAHGVQTMVQYSFNSGAVDHDLEFGLRIHEDGIDRFQWVDQYAMVDGRLNLSEKGVKGTESNRIETARAVAGYAQYRLELGNLVVTPGVRIENVTLSREDFGKNDIERIGTDLSERSNMVSAFIPGSSLIYKWNKFTSLIAGVHKGFAPPGSKEGTLPESSINYELGIRKYKNNYSTELIAFYTDYSNLLGSDLAAAGGTGSTDLFNGGDVITKGVEFSISSDLSGAKQAGLSIPVSASYTYTNGEFKNDFESEFDGWGNVSKDDKLPYLPQHQLSMGAGVTKKKLSIHLNGRFVSSMLTAPDASINDDNSIDGYAIFDGSVHYKLTPKITGYLTSTNVTNKVYVVANRPAGLRAGMPRALNIGIQAKL